MGGDEPNGGSSYHGSHVAGTIGAASNDGQGVAGVTWSGRNVLPVRVLGRNGGSFTDIAAGIQWAAGIDVPGLPHNNNRAQVINMSLGGQASPSQALQEVIDTVTAQGVVIVVAAGNSNIQGSLFSPCNQQNVICVGATRFNGKRASYSNYGTAVDVMATGGETAEDLNGDGKPDGVLSTIVDENKQPIWAYYQGTSMASPHVAGIVALMKSVNPNLTASQAEQLLKATADTSSQCTEGCGAGLVNAQAAVLEAKRLFDGSAPSIPAKLGVGSTQLSFSGSGTQQLTVRNVGGGSLHVTATASGTKASALSFPKGNTLDLTAYGAQSLAVAVNTTGLATGSYSAQVSLTATNGNSADVLVKFQVGSAQDKDAIIAFAYQDAQGEWQVDDDAVALASASKGYAYSLPLVPHTYFALATIDEDGDNQLFEDGERVGFWRDTTSIEPIPLEANETVSNVSFTLVPYQSEEAPPSASVIGQPCTSSGQCGSGGICAANYPGGYCTQECSTTSCPVGSDCYALTDGSAYCFATCTGALGTQGSCRSGYVCADDGTGGGACFPP
jgi:serine protease